ncbi:MAG: hypothetical protein EOO85_04185, partial [Pedobacter sp.]
LVASLQKWSEINPQEKVYLHMDKPYYAIGDTIWFKAYVVTGSRHQLSALSGALYVDLITEKDSIIKTLKLPISAGMSMGDLILDNGMNEGNYRLRAYTQWMRNAGEDYFFDRTFTVATPVSNEVLVRSAYKYDTVDGKKVLTAQLNYVNEGGKAMAGKEVQYDIMVDQKRIYTKSAKTDADGNISIAISNDKQNDWRGAYIRTIIENEENKKVIKDFPVKAGMAETDIQFFPESGNLINGILSKVAFKATGIDGLGLSVKGKVVDNDGKEIAIIETLHAGMGSFLINTESGKSYTAKLVLPDGSDKSVTLPQASDNGYVLSIYQPNKDSILVRVNTAPALIKSANGSSIDVNFIAQAGGETVIASPVKISRQVTSFWLQKNAFPSGIVQFTLFSNTGEPLNERIAFVKTRDQMQLKLSSSKSTYASKEKVDLELESRDRNDKTVAGNFSVSVIDESKVPMDAYTERSIFTDLLLTADLKGYVEKPGYYFQDDKEEVNRALDNLMLTQGYRRFIWKELAADPNTAYLTAPMFKKESLGTDISGVVKTLNDKVVPNAKVTLISTKIGVFESATADENGRFVFQGLVLTDSIKFTVQARTEKNGTKVEVVLDQVPAILVNKNKNIGDVSTNIPFSMKAYIDNSKKLDDFYEKTGQLNRVQKLREVNISARKKTGQGYAAQGPVQIPEGHSDQTYVIAKPENCATLGICLQGQLGGIVFKDYQCDPYTKILNFPHYRNEPMVTMLDGRMIRSCEELQGIYDANVLDPISIVKIEVVRTNLALMQISDKGSPTPTLFIYTNRGLIRTQFNPSVANIAPKGFNKAREFYSPKYDRTGGQNAVPDLRSTIYWNANLKTYSTGKTSFSYFNADGPGKYKVVVEGITADGELGRAVYSYVVDGNGATKLTDIPEVEAKTKFLSTALDTLRRRLPVEKVYLHTDKPYYNIGDTLWFKGYIVDGASVSTSKLSGLLYVELDDDSSEVVRRISVPIKNGVVAAQIPLVSKIFQEGGYTLRAYTNWSQNFGEDYVFSKRFYLGIPSINKWLVNASAEIKQVNEKDELDVDLTLRRSDNSVVGLRDVEVKIYEGSHWLYNEKLKTELDGRLRFRKALKEKADGRNLRAEIKSIHPNDGNQILQVPLNVKRNQKIDLQFLPESGKLVAGLKSVVAFKALAEDGRSTPVSGEIYNSKNIVVAGFETVHNGMGSFNLVPQAGEIYTAKLTQPEGAINQYKLPIVNPQGTVLHINALKESIDISVFFTPDVMKSDSGYFLIGTARGVVYYSKELMPDEEQTLAINKSKFPSGIVRFSLLHGKRPINERILFINHQEDLKLRVSTNKEKYIKRDSVVLVVDVKDVGGSPTKGSFSIAVTDDSQVRPDSTGNFSILSSLLLTSDLKGLVESPGYYLSATNEKVSKDLDLLMLTQGWSGFSWKDAFSPASVPKFRAEKELVITGRVTNILNKPVSGAPVLISSQKPTFINSVNTDAKGRFVFKNLPTIDSGSFFIQARTVNGKLKNFGGIEIERFRTPDIPSTLNSKVMPWYVNSDSAQLNYTRKAAFKQSATSLNQTGIALKEVNINTKKVIPGSQNRNGSGNADLVFDEKDIKESAVMNLYQLIRQKLPGLRITMEDTLPTLMLNNYMVVIEVDGGGLPLFLDSSPRKQDLLDALSEFQIAQFQGMEVMYSKKYLVNYAGPVSSKYFKGADIAKSENDLRQYGSMGSETDAAPGAFYRPGFKGSGYLEMRANVLSNKVREFAVIGITTRNRRGYFKNNRPDFVTYRPLPLMKSQEFYSPQYQVNPSDVAEPDFRSTVFWSPNVLTDANGRATLKFFTSDITGNYTISMEGIGTNGGIGTLRQKIKVE